MADLSVSSDTLGHLSTPVTRLRVILEKIQDRNFFKGASHGRAVLLTLLTNSLAEHYFEEEYHGELEETYPILVRCLKQGNSHEEALSAVRAIGLLVITIGDESGSWFAAVSDPLKKAIYDPSSHEAQAAALQNYAIAAYFGGADYQEMQSVMDLLLEVTDSEGEIVDSKGSGEVIAAALQAWGFLSSMIDDSLHRIVQAVATLENQLLSADPDVLVAAAENLALLYEQTYKFRHDDDSDDSDEEEERDYEFENQEEFVAGPFRKQFWTKKRDMGIDDYALKDRVKELSRTQLRYVKKDSRKEIHSVFRDVSHTLDYPWRGPHYSTALDKDAQFYYGHRLRHGNRMIDRWWKFHRSEELKRILQDGSLEHLSKNPNVSPILRDRLEPSSMFLHSNDIGYSLGSGVEDEE